MLSNVTHYLRVSDRSDNEFALFRSSNSTHKGIIYPGDKKIAMIIDYYVDDAIHTHELSVFDKKVVARLFISGEFIKTEEVLVKKITNF